MTMTYYDYYYKFPITGLSLALEGVTALRQAGLLTAGEIPTNMLGDPRDSGGNIIPPSTNPVTWVGAPGRASSIDPESGDTIPAAGDPAYYYIQIRAAVDPATLPFDPSIYGLVACDSTENAAVLGLWLGDTP